VPINTVVGHDTLLNTAAATRSPCSASHAATSSREGPISRTILCADSCDERGRGGVVGDMTPDKVGLKLGVWKVENRFETGEFVGREVLRCSVHERLQHGVELTHAAAATPA